MIFWQFFLKIHFVVERSPTLDRSRPDRRRRSDFGGCVSEPASIPFTCRFLVLILKGWSKFSRWSASLWTRHHRILVTFNLFPVRPAPRWGAGRAGEEQKTILFPVVAPCSRATNRLSLLHPSGMKSKNLHVKGALNPHSNYSSRRIDSNSAMAWKARRRIEYCIFSSGAISPKVRVSPSGIKIVSQPNP